jgi:hypothetical protein
MIDCRWNQLVQDLDYKLARKSENPIARVRAVIT